MDIILIEGTNRCFLNCSNCTRLVPHQIKTREMSPEQVREAIRSLKGWYQSGKVIGLIGGEPTLHSKFEEICKVFREELNPNMNCKHGRKPIKDMGVFENERLFDRSNGRGLWTSFGPRFMHHFETIMDTFSHHNPNDHTANGLHQALLIHREDYQKATGISDQEWEKNRDACWVQNLWSATINSFGSYPCEVMASIDQAFYGGKHAWPVTTDWWKRTPDQFGDMIKLCDHCSLAQKGPSSVDSVERDIISNKNRIALELIGSPAVKGGRYDEFNPQIHTEKRTVTTKDNYTAGPRVSPDNPYLKNKKLSAITVCVGREEHLARTLKHNAKLVDELIVVSDSPKEGESENIKFVHSSRCFEGGDAFNLGKMQNDGISALAPDSDWILFVTCDVFLNPNLMEFFRSHTLNPGVLYGTTRLNAKQETIDHYGLDEVFTNRSIMEVGHCVDSEPNGYFALWNRRARAIRERWPKVMAETFCSAGGVDSWFLQQWPRGKRIQVPELAVVHIDHAKALGSDWNGNKRANSWRQCGMLTGSGYFPTEDIPDGPIKLKMTDTNNGESATCEVLGAQFPMDIVKPDGNGGLIFKGKKVAGHIHIAYWHEGK